MKPRRDITLGEMQDECGKRMHICAPGVDGNNECKYFETCRQMRSGVFVKPCPEVWDLTDPPRFTEAQMAFWKALWCIGVRCVYRAARWYTLSSSVHDDCYGDMGTFTGDSLDWVEQGETLDLAELLGNDGAEC